MAALWVGAIKYVSKKPDLNDFSVSTGGDVASVDHGGNSYGGESFINLPLVDNQLALRIGGAYRYDAGYVDNVKKRRGSSVDGKRHPAASALRACLFSIAKPIFCRRLQFP